MGPMQIESELVSGCNSIANIYYALIYSQKENCPTGAG